MEDDPISDEEYMTMFNLSKVRVKLSKNELLKQFEPESFNSKYFLWVLII